MARAVLIVLDSMGCGGAPDANKFFNGTTPDTGANTLLHIAEACANGKANEGRTGPLRMPNLDKLGLGAAIRLATDTRDVPGFDADPVGLWAAATEQSNGKDTPSGHWELAGVTVTMASISGAEAQTTVGALLPGAFSSHDMRDS